MQQVCFVSKNVKICNRHHAYFVNTLKNVNEQKRYNQMLNRCSSRDPEQTLISSQEQYPSHRNNCKEGQ